MFPADGLVDEGHPCRSSSSKENCRDGNPKRVLPLLVKAGAVHQGGTEPGVGMMVFIIFYCDDHDGEDDSDNGNAKIDDDDH